MRLQLLLLYWAGGAVAGALLGSLVPANVTGPEFALTALVARVLFPDQLLLVAFALFVAVLLVRRLATAEGEPSHA